MSARLPTRSRKPKTLHLHVKPKQLIVLAALVLIMYVVVPQVGAFRSSLSLLKQADGGRVALAALFYLGTGLVSVGIYKALLSPRLPLLRTAVVEYGSSFANRLLPAGAGAVGVNYLYFKKQRYSTSTAVAVVTVNNILGFMGHLLLLAAVFLFAPEVWHSFKVPVNMSNTVVLAASAAVLLLVVWIVSRHITTKLREVLSKTWAQIAGFRHHPYRLLIALLFSVAITLLNSLSIWASAAALHVDITVMHAIIILAIGVGVGAIIPSPGGLGGAEAGLLVGLVACHVPPDNAVAVAILYRLVSYWLGFAVGAVAFFVAQKRAYF